MIDVLIQIAALLHLVTVTPVVASDVIPNPPRVSQKQTEITYALPEESRRTWPPERISERNPEVNVRAAIVIDNGSQEVLYGHNIDKQMPIASITKLMTFMVFLDAKPDWSEDITMLSEDRQFGGNVQASTGMHLSKSDTFRLALMASGNDVTAALVRSTGISINEYIDLMNTKANDLGLENTKFVDATGLRSGNISTVHDIAKILAVIEKSYPEISEVAALRSHQFTTRDGEMRSARTTNRLLDFPISEGGAKFVFGKTGFTSEAGGCLGVQAKGHLGQKINIVVLGSPTRAGRFLTAKNLADWALTSFAWLPN